MPQDMDSILNQLDGMGFSLARSGAESISEAVRDCDMVSLGHHAFLAGKWAELILWDVYETRGSTHGSGEEFEKFKNVRSLVWDYENEIERIIRGAAEVCSCQKH